VRSFASAFLAFVLTTVAPGTAFPGGTTGEPHAHDRLFVRLAVGGGTARTSITDPTGSIEFEGGAFELNVAPGHAVARNLILYGALFGPTMIDPRIEVADTTVRSGTFRGDAGTMGFGLGCTY